MKNVSSLASGWGDLMKIAQKCMKKKNRKPASPKNRERREKKGGGGFEGRQICVSLDCRLMGRDTWTESPIKTTSCETVLPAFSRTARDPDVISCPNTVKTYLRGSKCLVHYHRNRLLKAHNSVICTKLE